MTEVRVMQPEKGELISTIPMVNKISTLPHSFTLLGILMLLRLVQPANAKPPILVTLSGIKTVVRLVQLLKA